MATQMVRKQIYLKPRQDRKVKAIAATRGTTEAEVIRDAVDRLPDPEGDLISRLEAAGVILPPEPDVDPMTDDELRALEAEVEAIFESFPPEMSVSDAIIEERNER
jgi:Arc/MetJ-type ribon-helix-helix transcriptional regulator